MIHRLSRILPALLLAGGGSLWAQVPPEDDPNVRWAPPPAAAPQLPTGPVRAPRDVSTPTPSARTSLYLSLRAVSLADGEARVQTADGALTLRPGDLLGTDIVRAVDTGVIVLDRKAAPGAKGGDARVVVRFDGQGKPSVRIYHMEDPTRVEPQLKK